MDLIQERPEYKVGDEVEVKIYDGTWKKTKICSIDIDAMEYPYQVEQEWPNCELFHSLFIRWPRLEYIRPAQKEDKAPMDNVKIKIEYTKDGQPTKKCPYRETIPNSPIVVIRSVGGGYCGKDECKHCQKKDEDYIYCSYEADNQTTCMGVDKGSKESETVIATATYGRSLMDNFTISRFNFYQDEIKKHLQQLYAIPSGTIMDQLNKCMNFINKEDKQMFSICNYTEEIVSHAKGLKVFQKKKIRRQLQSNQDEINSRINSEFWENEGEERLPTAERVLDINDLIEEEKKKK
jgi:hypothetical protein